MRESTNTTPVLYTNELQFSWTADTFVWTAIDDGPGFFPGTVEGLCGLSATATLGIHTDTTAIRLSGRARYAVWIKIPTLSTGVQRFIFRTGIADEAGAGVAPSHAIQFRYSDNLSGGNWQCICTNAGVSEIIDSGVAVVAGRWYKLEWEVWCPDELICRFYITSQPELKTSVPVRVAVYNDDPNNGLPREEMGVVPFDFQKTVGGTARSVVIHKHRFVTDYGGAIPAAGGG
jgi:hypothetical protein